MPISISERLSAKASELGFNSLHITSAKLPELVTERLHDFIAAGFAGDMDWLAREPERRGSPHMLWPEARSALVLTMSYHHLLDHAARLAQADTGTISVYALNRDYHDVMKGRLKQLAGWLAGQEQAQVKVFVDTAPLMEKPLAQQAGVGWQGKHSNVVSRELGAWFFLGVILTDVDLPHDMPEIDHCGSCQACVQACPTQAFPAPYQLDARRCLSYLTIEHKGVIAPAFRKAMGNRIYGCDDCLAACPWNKFAVAASEIKLQARDDLVRPALSELAQLDDAAFRVKFSGSPVKRIGRERFVRNVLIAMGNSQQTDYTPIAKHLLGDASPLVRGMAVWALAQLCDETDFLMLKDAYAASETDADVRLEWGL